MRKTRFWLLLPLLLLTLATPVLADGPDGDVVIWGRSYTLGSGEEINGDLLVYGGNVTVEPNSEIKGDVTLFGGNLTLSGEVYGDVTVWGGNVNLNADATVRGQVMAVGGVVDRHPDADVRGGEIEGLPFSIPQTPDVSQAPQEPTLPESPPAERGDGIGHKIGSFFRSVFGIMLMMVLGVLVVAFIPRHTETVSETMVKDAGKSLVVGLIALVGGAIALVVLAVIGALLIATLCLAPIGLALFLPTLVAAIALLFGWIAAGLLLGTRVLRTIRHKEPTPVTAVAVGILVLSLVSTIPCIGWALALGIVVWSLGAVVNSRFGTRPWNAPTQPPTEAQPSSTDAPEADLEDYDPRIDKL
ncbi:MAG: hypothetical protein AB8I80_01280 [Anaerolineae bacterium]